MDGGALDLAPVGRIAALGIRVVGGKHFHHIAVFVLYTAGALDHVSALQAALGAVGVQPLILGDGLGQEVVGLNPQIPGEGDLPAAVLRTVGVVLHHHGLGFAFGVVGDGQLYGLQDSHHALGGLVQIFPEAEVQESQRNGIVGFGHAHPFTEVADGSGGKASSAHAAEGGHPGVIPAVHIALLHQRPQITLAQHGVVDAQPGKLNLTGMTGHGYVLHHPVVQGPVILKFQGAQ